MSGKTVTFRFPEEVIEVIEAQAQATGRNRTAVVLDALAQFYGFALPSPPANNIQNLQQDVEVLTQQVARLSEQLMQLQTRQPTEARVSAVAHVSDASQSALDAYRQNRQLDEQSLIDQLKHQARALDQILSANPDIVFVLDRRGRFTYINAAGSRVFGAERNYFLGKTFQELGFLSIEKIFTAQCEIVFTTGRTICDEMSFATMYEMRTYEYILSPIHRIDDEIDAVVCTARDITERKQAEMAIRESEENYRNLFEFANDSILITDLATQRLLNVNRNAARRLGYTRQELLQLSNDTINAPIDNDRREAIMQELQVNGSATFKHCLRHKNGKKIFAEVNCRIIEYEGKLAIQSFIRDISEQKKIEERLHLLEAAVSNVHDAVVICETGSSDQPRVTYVNQSFIQMSGSSLEEVVSRTRQIFAGVNPDFILTESVATSSEDSSFSLSEPLTYCENDAQEMREITVVPVDNEQGRRTHFVVIQHTNTAPQHTNE